MVAAGSAGRARVSRACVPISDPISARAWRSPPGFLLRSPIRQVGRGALRCAPSDPIAGLRHCCSSSSMSSQRSPTGGGPLDRLSREQPNKPAPHSYRGGDDAESMRRSRSMPALLRGEALIVARSPHPAAATATSSAPSATTSATSTWRARAQYGGDERDRRLPGSMDIPGGRGSVDAGCLARSRGPRMEPIRVRSVPRSSPPGTTRPGAALSLERPGDQRLSRERPRRPPAPDRRSRCLELGSPPTRAASSKRSPIRAAHSLAAPGPRASSTAKTFLETSERLES